GRRRSRVGSATPSRCRRQPSRTESSSHGASRAELRLLRDLVRLAARRDLRLVAGARTLPRDRVLEAAGVARVDLLDIDQVIGAVDDELADRRDRYCVLAADDRDRLAFAEEAVGSLVGLDRDDRIRGAVVGLAGALCERLVGGGNTG